MLQIAPSRQGVGERSKPVSEALWTVARAWASDKAELEDDRVVLCVKFCKEWSWDGPPVPKGLRAAFPSIFDPQEWARSASEAIYGFIPNSTCSSQMETYRSVTNVGL